MSDYIYLIPVQLNGLDGEKTLVKSENIMPDEKGTAVIIEKRTDGPRGGELLAGRVIGEPIMVRRELTDALEIMTYNSDHTAKGWSNIGGNGLE